MAMTRRAVFGASVAIVAIAAQATPALTAATMTEGQLALVKWAEFFGGDKGLEAAHHAVRAGYGIESVKQIGRHGERPGERKTVLIYFDNENETVVFDDQGLRSTF